MIIIMMIMTIMTIMMMMMMTTMDHIYIYIYKVNQHSKNTQQYATLPQFRRGATSGLHRTQYSNLTGNHASTGNHAVTDPKNGHGNMKPEFPFGVI